jgi:hypothetical protein
MRHGLPRVLAFLCLVAACSSANDTTSGSSSGAGTGSGSGTTGGGCPANYTLCGSLCCAPGKICTSPGRCDYPYDTADLYVYLCPSFNTGNCRASYFSIDQTCTPLQNPMPGTCYNTGFRVAGGQSYGISSCTGCATGCGNPSSLTTPAGFTKPNYYSGMSFYCGTPCTPPPDCSQAANAGGPASTTSSTSGAGGSGATGAGGAGGSIGTTTGTGGSGGICNASGSTKQCSQMVSCSTCSFQSCTCFDGSNCSAGYHTSDGLDFPCDSCPNGCTAAAQAVVAHCGCAP